MTICFEKRKLKESGMPHFIIHCSEDVLATHSEQEINRNVHAVANQSGLFIESDIKVRTLPFSTYLVGNQDSSFIHVFASIMQGRTEKQRAALSKAVVSKLVSLFPEVHNIAMNINEFEKSTYCNRAQL